MKNGNNNKFASFSLSIIYKKLKQKSKYNAHKVLIYNIQMHVTILVRNISIKCKIVMTRQYH